MYKNKKISLVIPAYNEEKLIKPTLENIPELFDKIYVVDDCSPDNQNLVINRCIENDERIELIEHETNQGPGGAIITGYLKSSLDEFDIAVVVGGDFQMPLEEVENLLDPLVNNKADYTKGNRFLLSQLDTTLKRMPRTRLLGNWIITGLTKIASGYYKIMDVASSTSIKVRLAPPVILTRTPCAPEMEALSNNGLEIACCAAKTARSSPLAVPEPMTASSFVCSTIWEGVCVQFLVEGLSLCPVGFIKFWKKTVD